MLGRICGIRAFTKHSLLCWPWPHLPIAQFQCYGRILSKHLTCPVDWTRSPPPTHAPWPLCGSCHKHARHYTYVRTKCGRPHRGSNRINKVNVSVILCRCHNKTSTLYCKQPNQVPTDNQIQTTLHVSGPYTRSRTYRVDSTYYGLRFRLGFWTKCRCV